jgi:hypothetical protein
VGGACDGKFGGSGDWICGGQGAEVGFYVHLTLKVKKLLPFEQFQYLVPLGFDHYRVLCRIADLNAFIILSLRRIRSATI